MVRDISADPKPLLPLHSKIGIRKLFCFNPTGGRTSPDP
jgi:hypothetical protein